MEQQINNPVFSRSFCEWRCPHLLMGLLTAWTMLQSPQTGYAQPIDSLLSLAKTQNPNLKMHRYNWESASHRSDQVAVYPDPQVSAGFGASPIETRLGSQQMRLGISQRLLWNGELNAKRELEDSRAGTLAYQADISWIELEYRIKAAYADLIYIDKVINLIEQNIRNLDILERIARDAIEGGKGRLSNVLLVHRRKEEFTAMIREIQAKRAFPTIIINRAIGRETDTPIDIIETTDSAAPGGVLVDVNFVNQTHPILKTLQQQKDVADKVIELTRFEAKPKVQVGLEYGMIDRRPGVNIASNGRDALMFMGSLTIPLHHKQYRARRDEEHIRQQALDASMEDWQNQFSAEIERANAMLEEAIITIGKYQTLQRVTENTIELMQTEYINDGSRFEEILRLQMDIVDYGIQMQQAIKMQQVATALLQKYSI